MSIGGDTAASASDYIWQRIGSRDCKLAVVYDIPLLEDRRHDVTDKWDTTVVCWHALSVTPFAFIIARVKHSHVVQPREQSHDIHINSTKTSYVRIYKWRCRRMRTEREIVRANCKDLVRGRHTVDPCVFHWSLAATTRRLNSQHPESLQHDRNTLAWCSTRIMTIEFNQKQHRCPPLRCALEYDFSLRFRLQNTILRDMTKSNMTNVTNPIYCYNCETEKKT